MARVTKRQIHTKHLLMVTHTCFDNSLSTWKRIAGDSIVKCSPTVIITDAQVCLWVYFKQVLTNIIVIRVISPKAATHLCNMAFAGMCIFLSEHGLYKSYQVLPKERHFVICQTYCVHVSIVLKPGGMNSCLGSAKPTACCPTNICTQGNIQFSSCPQVRRKQWTVFLIFELL